MGRVTVAGGNPGMKVPVAGLPSGYTRLAYIQSSGTQFIDTGVRPTVNTRFSFGIYMLEETGACIIGHSPADNNDYRIFNYSRTIYWDLKDGRLIGTSGSFPTNAYLEFECGNNYVNKNGQRVLTGTAVSSFSPVANIFVFSANGTPAGCSGRLYFLKIYEGDTLIRDFKPCISDAGAVGVFDLVNRKFYGNAGTGVFIGSEVA